jgi:hypothetical protein
LSTNCKIDMKLEKDLSLLEEGIDFKTEEIQSLKYEISELDRNLIGKREQLVSILIIFFYFF